MPDINLLMVIAIIVVAMGLFVSNRLRSDVIALCVLVALVVLGLIRTDQVLYGFTNPATATVAAMFVLTAGLVRTGVLNWVSVRIDRLAGRREWRLILVLCVFVAGLSAFLINTATVAIFIPVAIVLAQRRKISTSHVLIPLSYASQFGGVCTLIGTSTNILISSIAAERGLQPFGMFEFTRLGLVMSVVGVSYLLLTAKLLPKRKGEFEQVDKYRLDDYLAEFRVVKDSPLIGTAWGESKVSKATRVELANLFRGDKATSRSRRTRIKEDDLLLLTGNVSRLIEIQGEYGLELQKDIRVRDQQLSSSKMTLMEVLIPPRSNLIGRTLSSSDFLRYYRAAIIAIQRRGRVLRERLSDIKLDYGDTLLLQGNRDDLSRLLNSPNAIVTNELSELYVRRNRAVIAVLILLAVVLLAALGVVSIVVAAMLGAGAMVLSRCLDIEEAYQAIDWKVIFLLGGILPVGLAMEQNGVSLWIANTMQSLDMFGPVATLAAFYIVTAILTETMSNNAAAAILAPVAITVASSMNIDPRPLLIAITFAASTSFSTPIGYQTNTMIYAPGGYRFTDFFRIGAPLNLIFWGVAVLLIPVLWPF